MKIENKYLTVISFIHAAFCILNGDALVDPISMIVGGTVLSGIAYYLKCKQFECCDKTWVPQNISNINDELKKNLYGQKLAHKIIVQSLAGFVKKNPPKPLVLSLHGWTGNGKNFVSRIIANSLFLNGMDSSYVKMFIATRDFPHADRLSEYKDRLVREISATASSCEKSLFIFDEMDKFPNGLIDTLLPFLDFHDMVNGIDYRNSIFILISNSGGKSINSCVVKLWEEGRDKNSITLKEIESHMRLEIFNTGGYKESELISRNFVDAYIPFLPMERADVRGCILDEMKRQNVTKIRLGKVSPDDFIERVLHEMDFFPKGLEWFSQAGCKPVSFKVSLVMESLFWV